MIRLALLFALGLPLGWWLSAGMPTASVMPANSELASTSVPVPPADAPENLTLPREANGEISVPIDRLDALVRSANGTPLKMEQFLGEENREHFWRLCDWLQFDENARLQLLAILRESITERLAWEKANVTVLPRGKGIWSLRFPGDQGKSHEQLLTKLRGAFGQETATAIDLTGDLGKFFRLGIFTTDSSHGEIGVMVSLGRPSTGPGDETPVAVRVREEAQVTGTGEESWKDQSTGQSPLNRFQATDPLRSLHGRRHLVRLLPLLGTDADILRAATESGRIDHR